MSKNKKTVVCLCGGGTGTHILAGTIGAKENFIVNVFTRKPEKWTNEITVQSPSENKEFVGKINIVSSNPEEVFKDCDIFICNGPAMANPIYLKAMEPYLKDGAIIGSIFGQGGFDFAVLDIVGGRKEFLGSVELWSMEKLQKLLVKKQDYKWRQSQRQREQRMN